MRFNVSYSLTELQISFHYVHYAQYFSSTVRMITDTQAFSFYLLAMREADILLFEP